MPKLTKSVVDAATPRERQCTIWCSELKGFGIFVQAQPRVSAKAGMLGTRQLERVLSHAAEAGAKVVLVGDPKQLQAIEAGVAFRSIHERHGGAEIGEVRRQREDWQRDATRDLANRRTGHALAGTQFVSGGTASGTTVSSGGIEYVLSGGDTYSTI